MVENNLTRCSLFSTKLALADFTIPAQPSPIWSGFFYWTAI